MKVKYFEPYVPGTTGPWDMHTASHLLRRAGFGAAPADVAKAVEQGPEATVESLFDEAPDESAGFEQTFEAINGTMANFGDPGTLQAWWVHRMAKTRAPLREKLTLFWHGHFATSVHKVEDTYLLHRQNATLRRLAWENFRELVLAVARDPAMIVYLDGESNTKQHPNENFARELMELFTCGIGHYTERDVLDAARAFTGWHREGAEFKFVSDAHDDGRKQFLGKTGRFDGTDIVDILMQQPATPRFIARKLVRFFACPEPADDVVAEAAAVFDRTQFHIKWFLRELFLSQFFYSEACVRKRIASPVEFVVGTARTLNIRMPAQQMKDHVAAMGQELFAPPNVKGWDGEQKWINSSSWPARLAFANEVATLGSDSPFGAQFAMDKHVPAGLTDPQQVVDQLAKSLLQGELPAETRRELAAFLVTTDQGRNMDQFAGDEGFRNQRVREAMAMILSLPEYHAC